MFALDDNASFLHLKHWYEETFDATPEYLMSKIHKFMVGNKSDLTRKVNSTQIEDYSTQQYGISKNNIFEVSAKENVNIESLVKTIAESLAPKRTPKKQTEKQPANKPVRLCRFF